jgi:hypothetical protein
MPSYSKIPLSTTAIGAGVLLTSTGVPGVLVHQTQNNATDIDEIWLYANNTGTSDATMTVYWGLTGATNILGPINIQAYAGPTLVSPGLVLEGSGSTASVVYANSSVASGINIYGYINRITA